MRWIDQNGKFFTPPLIIDGAAHHSPSPELLLRAGYTEYIPPVPPQSPRVHRFSKLKIIKTLGERWDEYQKMLEEKGLYKQFSESTYLSTDDSVFGPIYRELPREDKRALIKYCRY